MKNTIFLLILTFLKNPILAQDATAIYNNTISSIVTIETNVSMGSGFFVSEYLIATNYHVIEGASEAYCYTNDSSIRYKIEGYTAVDKSVDLIFLKVLDLNRKPLKISSDAISPGQRIYAIGSPKGLPATIYDGIISGIREFDGIELIQLTAPISEGSSGGPVLDINGEVIGISVGQYKGGQNLNFAIPKSYLEILKKKMAIQPKKITTLYNLFGYITDLRDNQSYKTVEIGEQVWMAENLKATKFNDGTLIPLVINDDDWWYLSTPGYCWYNNDEALYKNPYGVLYNWYAVNTSKLCPKGWHVPSDDEWKTLVTYLGGDYVAYNVTKDTVTNLLSIIPQHYTIVGGKLKEAGTVHWKSPNTGATNESGFSALPGGHRSPLGYFSYIEYNGAWWSSTSSNPKEPAEATAHHWSVTCASNDVYVWYDERQGGLSIRCIKDNQPR